MYLKMFTAVLRLVFRRGICYRTLFTQNKSYNNILKFGTHHMEKPVHVKLASCCCFVNCLVPKDYCSCHAL